MTPRHEEGEGRYIDRRTVLATTAGVMGLAGCSSGGSSDDETTEETTTDGAGAPTADETTRDQQMTEREPDTVETLEENDGTGGCQNPAACSFLPGSFRTFEPGATRMPITFEYPDIVGDMEYLGSEGSNPAVNGRYNRCDPDNEFDGDVSFGVTVFFSGAPDEEARDEWYQDQKSAGAEVFTTAELYGETAEFLWFPDSENRAKGTSRTYGLIPYQDDAGKSYHKTEISGGISLVTTDADTATDACAANIQESVMMMTESLGVNSQTTFGQ